MGAVEDDDELEVDVLVELDDDVDEDVEVDVVELVVCVVVVVDVVVVLVLVGSRIEDEVDDVVVVDVLVVGSSVVVVVVDVVVVVVVVVVSGGRPRPRLTLISARPAFFPVALVTRNVSVRTFLSPTAMRVAAPSGASAPVAIGCGSSSTNSCPPVTLSMTFGRS